MMKEFKFPFTTEKSGDYELCIINYDYDLYYLLYVLSHLCVLWLRLK